MLLRASLIALFLATPALAADMVEATPEPMPVADAAYGWTGLYVGGQLGGAIGGDREGLAIDINGDGDFRDIDGLALDRSDEDDAGVVGGLRIGYDKQFGNLVVGAVADLSYLGAEINSDVAAGGEFLFGIDQTVDVVGTVRGRLGYAVDRTLVYGTGGVAIAGIENDFRSIIDTADFPGSRVSDTDDETLVGYAVGGGIDYALNDRIAIGAEYLYTRFDDAASTVTYTLPGDPDFSARSDDRLDFHRLSATVSYRFD